MAAVPPKGTPQSNDSDADDSDAELQYDSNEEQEAAEHSAEVDKMEEPFYEKLEPLSEGQVPARFFDTFNEFNDLWLAQADANVAGLDLSSSGYNLIGASNSTCANLQGMLPQHSDLSKLTMEPQANIIGTFVLHIWMDTCLAVLKRYGHITEYKPMFGHGWTADYAANRMSTLNSIAAYQKDPKGVTGGMAFAHDFLRVALQGIVSQNGEIHSYWPNIITIITDHLSFNSSSISDEASGSRRAQNAQQTKKQCSKCNAEKDLISICNFCGVPTTCRKCAVNLLGLETCELCEKVRLALKSKVGTVDLNVICEWASPCLICRKKSKGYRYCRVEKKHTDAPHDHNRKPRLPLPQDLEVRPLLEAAQAHTILCNVCLTPYNSIEDERNELFACAYQPEEEFVCSYGIHKDCWKMVKGGPPKPSLGRHFHCPVHHDKPPSCEYSSRA